ncbi:MAG: addiction module protein [Chthoniobacteraceae bacterium]
MILERFPEILKLSHEELCQLHSELGESLVNGHPDLNAAVLALLEKRHAEYLEDPSLARPWEEVRDRIFGKKGTTAGAE